MSNQLKYYGSTKTGEFVIKNGKFLDSRVLRFFPDQDVQIIIEKKRSKRSSQQNRWLWGVAYKLLTAYFRDWNPGMEINTQTVHEYCKSEFLPIVFNGEIQTVHTESGDTIDLPYSTTKLTIPQFDTYKTLIQQFGDKLDIDIPDPNPEHMSKSRAKFVNIDTAA